MHPEREIKLISVPEDFKNKKKYTVRNFIKQLS
jgi:hypothetical protein